MIYAPIALFAYKRPKHTLKVLEALACNSEASKSKLYVFCEAPKKQQDWPLVHQTREIVRQKQWCREVQIIERETNLGCANSIIQGVTEVCDRYGRVIVLEDDLIISPYFLQYMNAALDRYANEPKVMQISGHMFPVELKTETDAVFLSFPTSWGWATWQRAWQCFDPNISGYETLRKDRKLRYQFDLSGSYPYFSMLEAQRNGEIDSWAIRWYLSVFMQQGLTLFPVQSLVENTGFDGSGTHCGSYYEKLSNFNESNFQKILSFPNYLRVNSEVMEILRRYFYKPRLVSNIFDIVRNFLSLLKKNRIFYNLRVILYNLRVEVWRFLRR